MSAGGRAWALIAVFVAVWDALCPADQLLTDVCRRHRAATAVGVAIVGGHLAGLLPPQVDPLHRIAHTIRVR